MKHWHKGVVINASLFIITLGCSIAAYAQARGVCKRDILILQTKHFLSLIEDRNSLALKLDTSMRYTENGKEHSIGEGLWRTAGRMLLKRTIVDDVKCSTHTQAVIEENGKLIIYGARIKYNKEKIAEIESFVARDNEFAFNAKGLLETKEQKWEEILPIEQRSSRLAMIAAADDYFNMFVKVPRVNVPFSYPCDRWENGTQTTIKSSNVSTVPGAKEHDCSPKGLVTPHHKQRRFLVDVEAGVVVAYVLFTSGLPDFHMFKMRNGKIELIQAVIGAGSDTMGWPDEPIIQ
jgi:hypothetical protein